MRSQTTLVLAHPQVHKRYCSNCQVYHAVDGVNPCRACYEVKCIQCGGVSVAANPFKCPYCRSKTGKKLGVKSEAIPLTTEELRLIVHPTNLMVCPRTGCTLKLRAGPRDKLRSFGIKS